jgi:hypothetical protein
MRRSLPTRDPMIGITVTAEAYVAIKATLPADTQTWPTSPAHQGDVIICLDQAMVDRLGAMRGPGESYSDVSDARRYDNRGAISGGSEGYNDSACARTMRRRLRPLDNCLPRP